jgi:clathrin heavy chain
VWSELGHAYLAAGQVPDAIAAYLRSNDTSKYAEVIDACKGESEVTWRLRVWSWWIQL